MNAIKNSAFSLIELMVVIAIVAVLSVIATPLYKEYSTKATVASVIPVIEEFMREVNIYYYLHGTLPLKMSDLGHSEGGGTINNGADFSTSDFNTNTIVELGFWGYNGCAPGSNACAWVALDKNLFGLTQDPQVHFNIYISNDGTIAWNCEPYGSNNIDTRYLPSTCM